MEVQNNTGAATDTQIYTHVNRVDCSTRDGQVR